MIRQYNIDAHKLKKKSILFKIDSKPSFFSKKYYVKLTIFLNENPSIKDPAEERGHRLNITKCEN